MVLVSNVGYRAIICNTKTGQFDIDLPISSSKWSVKLNGAGTIDLTFPFGAEELATLDVKASTTPVWASAGLMYDDNFIECGPIWKREYDAETDRVTLHAEGLWSIFDRRKLVDPTYVLLPTADGVMSSTVSITAKELGSIAREIVYTVTHGNGTFPNLNLVLPASVAGTNDRNYDGFDLGWAGERLYELSQVENGPDIRFRPRNGAAGYIEWAMETGTGANPLLVQSGDDWHWDTDAPDSAVVSIGEVEDATELASFAWVPGNGQGIDMKLSTAKDLALVNAGYPWLETEEAHKTVETQSVLDGHANRVLNDHAAPWRLFKLRVRADMTPRLGTYQPGDWAQVHVGAGHWISEGTYRCRIVGMEGDDTEIVTVVVAPIQGGES